MSTVALTTGTYRAASLRQVWAVQLDAIAQPMWRLAERLGRQLEAARLAQAAERIQACHPDLARTLRRSAEDIVRTGHAG